MSKHCLNFSLCWRRRKARIRFYFFCFLRFLRWSALFLIILFASKRKCAVLSLGIMEKGSPFSHKGFRPASCLAADHSSPQLKTGDCFFFFLNVHTATTNLLHRHKAPFLLRRGVPTCQSAAGVHTRPTTILHIYRSTGTRKVWTVMETQRWQRFRH